MIISKEDWDKGIRPGSLDPVCFTCDHYWFDKELKCDAFPEGIPEGVYYDHSKPFPGDNGIRFVPISEEKKKRILRDLFKK